MLYSMYNVMMTYSIIPVHLSGYIYTYTII